MQPGAAVCSSLQGSSCKYALSSPRPRRTDSVEGVPGLGNPAEWPGRTSSGRRLVLDVPRRHKEDRPICRMLGQRRRARRCHRGLPSIPEEEAGRPGQAGLSRKRSSEHSLQGRSQYSRQPCVVVGVRGTGRRLENRNVKPRPWLRSPGQELREAVHLIVETPMWEGENLKEEVVEPRRQTGKQHVARLDHGTLCLEANDLFPVVCQNSADVMLRPDRNS